MGDSGSRLLEGKRDPRDHRSSMFAWRSEAYGPSERHGELTALSSQGSRDIFAGSRETALLCGGSHWVLATKEATPMETSKMWEDKPEWNVHRTE